MWHFLHSPSTHTTTIRKRISRRKTNLPPNNRSMLFPLKKVEIELPAKIGTFPKYIGNVKFKESFLCSFFKTRVSLPVCVHEYDMYVHRCFVKYIYIYIIYIYIGISGCMEGECMHECMLGMYECIQYEYIGMYIGVHACKHS